MDLKTARDNLNKTVIHEDKIRRAAAYPQELSAIIVRRNVSTGSLYYEAELTDRKFMDSRIYCGLEDIREAEDDEIQCQ